MVNKAMISTKLKFIWAKYRWAVVDSGHGGMLLLYFELCEKILGGPPMTSSLSTGISPESDIVSANSASSAGMFATSEVNEQRQCSLQVCSSDIPCKLSFRMVVISSPSLRCTYHYQYYVKTFVIMNILHNSIIQFNLQKPRAPKFNSFRFAPHGKQEAGFFGGGDFLPLKLPKSLNAMCPFLNYLYSLVLNTRTANR